MSADLEKLQSTPRDLALWQKAQRHQLEGRPDRALANYTELLQQYPDVVQLWFEHGMAAAGDLEFDLANQSFRLTLELAPKDSPWLFWVGQQYHRLRRLDQARDCFERAFAANPVFVQARLNLADWFEKDRKLDKAWDCVDGCLARHPQNPHALFFRARLLQRTGRAAEAETVVRNLIKSNPSDPDVQCNSRHLLGVVLDELGQYAEAMRWLTEAKNLSRKKANVTPMEKDYDRADHRRRALLAALKPADVQRWRDEAASATPQRHRLALLGGHPRSGTTLLEQILGAHPEISALDESEAFAVEVVDELAPIKSTQALTPNALNTLSPARRTELQRNYFKSLLREFKSELETAVLLDKNPSTTASLHIWLRLFPEFKIVIALRDPRDVIISCYFQNLALTTTNANFLSLERTAKHFSDLTDVWLRLRELGGFNWMETRYEDIVAGPQSEGRRVTEFLGLAWHPTQASHHEAAGRKFIFSPTYAAVTKPINNRAVGRWKNYADALAPVQSKLEPYCRAFRYD